MAILLLLAAALTAQDAGAYLEAAHFQGTALLAKDGKVLLAKGYGLANREHGVPNKPETKFRLGSITKQFTAAAILQLQEKGKLSVHDKIAKYVPDTPPAWSAITIHHLLTHTSGIPNYTDPAEYERRMRERPGTPLAFVRRFRELPLDFQPGHKFSYSNSGYFLLGVIIEQVSGQTYEDYLRRNIFEPLEMRDTGYDHPETILPNRAAGYTAEPNPRNADFLDMGQPYAAGSLYSTVLDLYKWDRALYTTKVLTKPSIDAAFTPNPHEWGPGIRYGYGWGITGIGGTKAVGHGGGINGFSTVIWRDIDRDAVVILLSNVEGDNSVGKTGKELMERLVKR